VVDEVLGGDKEGVTAVKLKNVQTGDCTEVTAAGLFLAIGHTPNTSSSMGR